MNSVNNNRRQVFDDMFDAFSMLALGNYVSLYDTELKLTRYTPAAVELFGLPGEYIPDGAADWSDYVHPEDRKRYQDAMQEMFARQTLNYDISYRVRTTKGEYIQFRFVGAVIRNDAGIPSMIGGIIINEGVQAIVDGVTILRNQYGFFLDLPAFMQKNTTHTVLLIGVNRINEINKVMGYGHGNKVLQQISWEIQEAVKDKGLVYRMNGSKFAIVSEVFSEVEMTIIYRKIRQKLLSSIRVDNSRHNLTINGGLISFKGFVMDPRTLQSCLNYAYRESKDQKHGTLVNFDGNSQKGRKNTLAMLTAIRSDLIDDCKDFFLEYQPVFSTEKEELIGVEALIRWKNDEYGVVMPSDFIHILEEDVAFEELGDWILRTALNDGKKIIDKNPDIVVGVNLSPAQIEDEFFVDNLKQMLQRTGFPAKNLCLEFSKECRLLDTAALCAIVLDLHDLGVKILIDDFGSGFGSLDILKALPVDYVKFDRKLVQNIHESDEDLLILEHLSELVSVYGVHLCVKGVENQEICNIVKQFAIRSMQGYLFEPAIPIDAVIKEYF